MVTSIRNLPAFIKRKIPSAKIPVEYEQACKALAACVSIDEAKYWNDASEALAAWARIYKSDRAALESRRLKLYAFRRMGEIAKGMHPRRLAKKAADGTYRGRIPGHNAELLAAGLRKSEASAATKLASLSATSFENLRNSPVPPKVWQVEKALRRTGTSEWLRFIGNGGPLQLRSFCRRHRAADFARSLSTDEAIKARECALEISDWLDEFEQHLPK